MKKRRRGSEKVEREDGWMEGTKGGVSVWNIDVKTFKKE